MQALQPRFNSSFPIQGRPLSAGHAGFHLRYRSLFREGHGYSFPCDADGHVDMDRLSERVRLNYLFARGMVGKDLHVPEIVRGAIATDGT